MLVVFLKSAILFVLVLIVMRIMGKRQLGEMQPFELVITLILAEVACIPMNDPYIPLYTGIVPIITLGTLHMVLTMISKKSVRGRNIISGKPVIVIDKDGLNYENMQKMNLSPEDLSESVRSAGYADFNEIAYAIFETNGKLCVIEKFSDPTEPAPALLPITLFSCEKWNKENIETAGLTQTVLENLFRKHGLNDPKDVFYADIRQDGLVYVSPKKSAFFTETLKIKGEW